jgi:hypothetical protein
MQQVFSLSGSDMTLVAIAETPGGESGHEDRRRSDGGLMAVARSCGKDAGIDDTRVGDGPTVQGNPDSLVGGFVSV